MASVSWTRKVAMGVRSVLGSGVHGQEGRKGAKKARREETEIDKVGRGEAGVCVCVWGGGGGGANTNGREGDGTGVRVWCSRTQREERVGRKEGRKER